MFKPVANTPRFGSGYIQTEVVQLKPKPSHQLVELIEVIATGPRKYHFGHWKRHLVTVAVDVYLMALSLGFKESDAAVYRAGGLFHDWGKVGNSEMRKLFSEGNLSRKFTPKERRLAEQHRSRGVLLVKRFLDDRYDDDSLRKIIAAQLTHDVRFDQAIDPYAHLVLYKGPYRPRKGKGIPLAGRMTAVADVFDAMTDSRRQFQETSPPHKAVAKIKGLAGSHLDPELVEVFTSRKVLANPARPGLIEQAMRKAALRLET